MMTPKERAAMQQALEALEICVEKFYAMKSTGVIGALPMQAVKAAQTITALREALAEQACPNGCDTSNGRCVDCPDYVAKQAEQEPVAWIEGYPKDFYAEEWFIAITIYGDRVVLKALPENYSYDFTTADGTYMKKENVKRWMQFPDSEFLPPTVATPVRTKDLTDEEIDAFIDRAWDKQMSMPEIIRAVIAADRSKNGIV